jgi:hypothetical protein
MKAPLWLTAALSAIAAPACDIVALHELKVGVSTAAEVRSRMGLPQAEHRNADGSVTYEYSRQPQGIDCHMITIGPDQVVKKIEQALSEPNLAKVVAGMDRDTLRRLLGKPGSVVTFPNSGEEVWDWRVAGMIPTEEAHFHAHLDPATGLVLRTSRRVEPKG